MANADMIAAVAAKCNEQDGGLAECFRVCRVNMKLVEVFASKGLSSLAELTAYFTAAAGVDPYDENTAVLFDLHELDAIINTWAHHNR